jgi:acyl-CoA thioesterase-2
MAPCDASSSLQVGEALEELLELLDLEQLDLNLFRGVSPRDFRDRIFGGQVLAQAMVAAGRTVEGRLAHSLHAYFLRSGDPRVPIVFDVDRIRDGRSFTTRRVVAIQRGEAILNMAVSFHVEAEGFEHQQPLPDVLPPDGQPLYDDALRDAAATRGFETAQDDRRFELPVELRTVGGFLAFDEAQHPPRMETWIRSRGPMPDDPALHQCVLAYASDLTVIVSAVYPHRVAMMSPGFRTASLDHAMWFHRPFRIDDWLLHVQDSPVSARSRGLGRGTIYTRGGELVASCAQEGLMRLVR